MYFILVCGIFIRLETKPILMVFQMLITVTVIGFAHSKQLKGNI